MLSKLLIVLFLNPIVLGWRSAEVIPKLNTPVVFESNYTVTKDSVYFAREDQPSYSKCMRVLTGNIFAEEKQNVDVPLERHDEYVYTHHEMTPLGLAECREVREITCMDCNVSPGRLQMSTHLPLLTTFKYRGGKGRSYSEGFESAELFLAYHCLDRRCYPFIDLKTHRVGEGKFAGNCGLGWRVFSKTREQMFGANVYYDYRKISNGGLHQLGVGIELLGECWDIRGNGYIPLANQRAFVGRTNYSYINPTYTATAEEFEQGMWGGDMEIGQHLCRTKCFEIYNAVGPYFYGSTYNTNSMVGVMGRIRVKYKQYLTLQFFITHDRNLKTLGQGEISITLPSSHSKRFRDCSYKPVERNNIILTEFVFSDWITSF